MLYNHDPVFSDLYWHQSQEEGNEMYFSNRDWFNLLHNDNLTLLFLETLMSCVALLLNKIFCTTNCFCFNCFQL